MTPESLQQTLTEVLLGARAAVAVEDGTIATDLGESKYSVSGEHNKCLRHLGSHERNMVRRVLNAEIKAGTVKPQFDQIPMLFRSVTSCPR